MVIFYYITHMPIQTKSFKKLLAILLVLCSATFAQISKLIISVSGELEIDIADVLMDGISYGLKNNNKYEILINDRQFKETLKKEWMKGNISDDKIIALAKVAGADYLCFTKIKSVKGLKGKQVTAQIYNLNTMSNTGEMGMKTIKDDFSDLEDLTKIILSVVDDMLSTVKSNSGEENSKSFTDSRDGKQYKIVTIGKQTWMAENLNYEVKRSGIFTNEVSNCYDNNPANCDKYGKLYTWSAAMIACPKGWHLPSKSEWESLTTTVGGSSMEGKYLKSINRWNDFEGKSGNGTDAYGFAALPGGYRSANSFYEIGYRGYWWTSSEYKHNIIFLSRAYYKSIYYENSANWYDGKETLGLSVRCLQD